MPTEGEGIQCPLKQNNFGVVLQLVVWIKNAHNEVDTVHEDKTTIGACSKINDHIQDSMDVN